MLAASVSMMLIVAVVMADACPCPNRTHEPIGQRDSSASKQDCKGTSCTIKFTWDGGDPNNLTVGISCEDEDEACITSFTTDDSHGECIGDHVQQGSYCTKNGTYKRRRMVLGEGDTGCNFDWFGNFTSCDALEEDQEQQEEIDNFAGLSCDD